MPLDLSGFALPEQKFEGLYKLGEALQENKILQQKTDAAAAKAAREAAKESAAAAAKAAKEAKEDQQKQQANTALGMSYLDELYNKKKYATGNFGDDTYMNGRLNSSLSKFQDLLLKNPGMDINQLKAVARQDANDIWDEKTNLSAVNQIAETAKKDLANKPGVDADAAYNQVRNYYLKDANGNIKTDFSDVKVDPNEVPKILLGSGNVFNSGSFDDYVAKSGTTTRSVVHSKQVGKNKVDTEYRTNAPTNWVSEEQDGQITFVPKYEIATDDGAPLMHTIIKDGKPQQKEIRMVDENIFNDLGANQKNYLDQQTAKFVAQSPTTPTETQKHQFQKALAYHELETSSKLKLKSEKVDKTKIGVNVNTGGTQADKDLEEQKNQLYPSLDTEERDTKNRMDITKYLPEVKAFGSIKAGQGISVKYDPTKKEVTIIDSDGNENLMPFNKFISTIQTANTKDDRKFVSLIGKYKPGKKAPKAAAPTPPPPQSKVTPQIPKKGKLWD